MLSELVLFYRSADRFIIFTSQAVNFDESCQESLLSSSCHSGINVMGGGGGRKPTVI